MKQLTTLISLTILFFSFQSKADFLFSPYLGYESGTVVIKSVAPDQNFKDTAFDLGAHVGYSHMGFWVGADLTYAMAGTSKPDAGSDDKYTRTEYGPAVGFHFANGIGLYGVYVLSATTTLTPTTGPNQVVSGVSGYKAGLTFRVAPKVSLGAEYYSNTANKIDQGSGATDLTTAHITSIVETGARLVVAFHF